MKLITNVNGYKLVKQDGDVSIYKNGQFITKASTLEIAYKFAKIEN